MLFLCLYSTAQAEEEKTLHMIQFPAAGATTERRKNNITQAIPFLSSFPSPFSSSDSNGSLFPNNPWRENSFGGGGGER